VLFVHGATFPSETMFDVKRKPTYDAAAIRARTLLVVGVWDVITPPEQGLALFKRLVNARERRVMMLSEGSHCIGIEKNRMHLIREVQSFLEEPSGP
jgi:dipeptidyl aminopeptidase/acylaminoacyl peptidase